MEALYGTFCGRECSVCEPKSGLCLAMSRGNWCLYLILKPSGALRPGLHSHHVAKGEALLANEPMLTATTYIIAELGAKHWYNQDPKSRFVIADPSVIMEPEFQ